MRIWSGYDRKVFEKAKPICFVTGMVINYFFERSRTVPPLLEEDYVMKKRKLAVLGKRQ